MIRPTLSPVAPRVLLSRGGVAVPLAGEIEHLLEDGRQISVAIEGEGITSALEHLACVFSEQLSDGRLRLEPESSPSDGSKSIVTIHTAHETACEVQLHCSEIRIGFSRSKNCATEHSDHCLDDICGG